MKTIRTTANLSSLTSNEDGIVAISVSLIILLIVSLITLGFARLMQREQRQALDRQLSTQAFYAAESAINDARRSLKEGKQISKTDCKDSADVPRYGGTISSDGAVDYTCLLVDSALPDLRYSDIGVDNGRQIVVQTTAGSAQPVGRLRIEWDRSALVTDFGATANLPPYASWPSNRPDMLRVVVFKRSGGGYESRTFFVTPGVSDASGTGEVDYASAVDPQIVLAHCATPNNSREYACRVDIKGSFGSNKRTGAYDQGDTVVAITSVYKNSTPSAVRVMAYNSTPSAPSVSDTTNQRLLINSQYRIDATGKASDVFRRLQVRVSQALDYYRPERVIETTQTLCKRFITEPADTKADDADGCMP